MSKDPKLAEVGPWAEQKLSALAAYLDYYTTVLKKQTWCRTIFFDAFAGGGEATIRQKPQVPDSNVALWDEPREPDQIKLIQGSPRRALDLTNPFTRYVFVDADPMRIAELEELKSQYADTRTIDVRQGSAADEIQWLLSQNISKRTHRGVAFLDPFGAHLPWASVEALAKTGVFEAIINFPLHMAINRLMTLNSEIPMNWRVQLDEFFGPGWYDQVYETRSGLFGSEVKKRPDAKDRLLIFYRKKLKSAFGHVSKPMLIRNTVGGPLYYLLWAGPHSAGLKGADYVLKTGEKVSR